MKVLSTHTLWLHKEEVFVAAHHFQSWTLSPSCGQMKKSIHYLSPLSLSFNHTHKFTPTGNLFTQIEWPHPGMELRTSLVFGFLKLAVCFSPLILYRKVKGLSQLQYKIGWVSHRVWPFTQISKLYIDHINGGLIMIFKNCRIFKMGVKLPLM